MNRKGFTLIEILIVVAIIGILASIVLVGLGPARRAGQDARRIADLRQIQTALELYHNKNGTYPNFGTPGVPGGPPGTTGSGNASTDFGSLDFNDVGVANIPHDPRIAGAGTPDYMYESDGSSYILGAQLEGSAPATYLGTPLVLPFTPTDTTFTCNGDATPAQYCIVF